MRKVTGIGTLLLLATAMVGATPRGTGETLATVSHSEGTHLQSSKRGPRETTTLVEVLRRLNREKGTYFLFSDASIGGVSVQSPNLKESTDKIIYELTRQAGLSFTKVSENTFVIRGSKGAALPEATATATEPLSNTFVRMEDLRAEQIIINGKVLSAKDNTPLENVTVRIVGTKKGTTTRADGSYTITIERGQSLEFSRVNMISRTVKSPDGRSEVIVVLQESENNLSEVVVVAYSNQKRSTFTGSAATIKNTAIESAPNASVQESLQGNIAGVQSANGSGQPGSVPNIRVRGIGSISASATPLYVIDGIPVVSGDISGLNSNTIAGLNANDIQSLTILKDASATSLYGSRAANGVILITTKTGKAGKAKVNFTFQQGYNNYNIRDEQKTLTTPQYLQYYKEGWANAGGNPASYDSLLAANNINKNVNTDWFDEVLRKGQYQQYNINFSGGNDKSTYFMSGSYYKSEAPSKGVNYDKATYRLNMTSNITNKWSVKGGFSGNFQQSTNFLGGSFFGNPIRAMYRLAPWLPVYKSDGQTYDLSYNSGYNPVAVIETTKRNAKTYNIGANASTKYEIAKGLSFESSAALDFNHAFRTIFYDPRVGNANVAVGGSIENYTQDITNWISTNILRYKREFKGEHSFEAFAGYEAQSRGDVDISIIVNGIAPGTSTPAGGSSPELTTGTGTGNRLVSKFLNTNYSWKDRYFLSGSVREDASSRFAKNFQSAVFWSIGGGWNIHNENFFRADWVNELRIRGSYGYTGNQGIDNFESQGLYSAGSDYNFGSGLTISQLANDNLTWEKNIPLDLGLEFSLLKGRLSGTFDWYKRISSQLLVNQSIPSVNGVTSITVNNGAMENKGIELSISSVNIAPASRNGFKWVTDFNFTRNRNRITEIDSLFSNNGAYFRRVGNDYYTHYQRAYAGVNPANGEALWYTSSAKDSTTNVFTTGLPRVASGSALPKFFGGITNSFSYQGFQLSFQIYMFWGNRIYDEYGYLQKTDANLGFSDQSNGMSRYEYERRWTTPGQVTDVPKAVFLGTQSSAGSYESTRFLYDGSYIRLRDVSLSYSLPKNTIAKAKLNGARIYMRGQNLYTFVKDKRFNTDPEVGIDGVMSQRPPVFRTILFGIDITL
jgi:TonB-dependent starch-binding outer membrane protein SusC